MLCCISGSKLTSFLNNQRCHCVTEVKIHFEVHKFLGFCACKDTLYRKTQLKQCSWICFPFLQLLFHFFFFAFSSNSTVSNTSLSPLCIKKYRQGWKEGFESKPPLWRRSLYHRKVYILRGKTTVTISKMFFLPEDHYN